MMNCGRDEWHGHVLWVRRSDVGGLSLGWGLFRRKFGESDEWEGKARLRVANYQGEMLD